MPSVMSPTLTRRLCIYMPLYHAKEGVIVPTAHMGIHVKESVLVAGLKILYQRFPIAKCSYLLLEDAFLCSCNVK